MGVNEEEEAVWLTDRATWRSARHVGGDRGARPLPPPPTPTTATTNRRRARAPEPADAVTRRA